MRYPKRDSEIGKQFFQIYGASEAVYHGYCITLEDHDNRTLINVTPEEIEEQEICARCLQNLLNPEDEDVDDVVEDEDDEEE